MPRDTRALAALHDTIILYITKCGIGLSIERAKAELIRADKIVDDILKTYGFTMKDVLGAWETVHAEEIERIGNEAKNL